MKHTIKLSEPISEERQAAIDEANRRNGRPLPLYYHPSNPTTIYLPELDDKGVWQVVSREINKKVY